MTKLELPEIETLRRDLERDAVGRKIKSVDLRTMKSIEGHRTKRGFSEALVGAKVDSVDRVGETMVIKLNNEQTMLITLGKGARLERVPSTTASPTDIEITIT